MSSQNLPTITILITAWKEPFSVGKNVETILSNQNNFDFEIVVIAPDIETRDSSSNAFIRANFTNYQVLTDPQLGKPNAINLALAKINSDWIICTDGDVVLYPDSIPTLIQSILNLQTTEAEDEPELWWEIAEPNIGAISARPISIDLKDNFWGYVGHLLADSAHVKRSQSPNYFVSGYLCAYQKSKIKPLPASTLVDDAQFSIQILQQNFGIKYLPESKVGVKYPTNLREWLLQKRRSAGGYRELKNQIKSLNLQSTQRSFWNELEFMFYPLQYAKNLKELSFSLMLYPLRLLLWILIFKDGIIKPKKTWERVESTKIVE